MSVPPSDSAAAEERGLISAATRPVTRLSRTQHCSPGPAAFQPWCGARTANCWSMQQLLRRESAGNAARFLCSRNHGTWRGRPAHRSPGSCPPAPAFARAMPRLARPFSRLVGRRHRRIQRNCARDHSSLLPSLLRPRNWMILRRSRLEGLRAGRSSKSRRALRSAAAFRRSSLLASVSR